MILFILTFRLQSSVCMATKNGLTNKNSKYMNIQKDTPLQDFNSVQCEFGGKIIRQCIPSYRHRVVGHTIT